MNSLQRKFDIRNFATFIVLGRDFLHRLKFYIQPPAKIFKEFH